MKIKNLVIKEGETKRAVVYIKGKKHYAVIKCLDVQLYQRCSKQDQARHSVDED